MIAFIVRYSTCSAAASRRCAAPTRARSRSSPRCASSSAKSGARCDSNFSRDVIVLTECSVDDYCEQQEKLTGFLAVGRPRAWQDKCFDKLRAVVRERIEANQLEDRSHNKHWLVRCVQVL